MPKDMVADRLRRLRKRLLVVAYDARRAEKQAREASRSNDRAQVRYGRLEARRRQILHEIARIENGGMP